MRAPRTHRSGTVGVFAPSSPFPEDRFERGVEVLARLGFAVRVPAAARARRGYLAGDDEARLAAFHALLDDPEIDVLWAARGGYGLHRIVDRLDPARIAGAGKPIVGFSDICVIHAAAQRGGLGSIHGPVITQLGDLDATAAERVATILAGAHRGLEDHAVTALAPGRATGPLVGGCLSVLVPLLGTPYLPSFEGSILLLEDVGEASYRIDRMLTHLRLSGALRGVAGIACGEMVGCAARTAEEPSAEEVIAERLGDLGIPVVAGLPFGHGRNNLALPLGAIATLDADRAALVLEG